jgi:hypothetical protein
MGRPALVDLLITAGVPSVSELTWTDDDGDPIDVSGYSARLQARRRRADTAVATMLSSSAEAVGYAPDHRVQLGGADGKVTIRFGPSTAALTPGAYQYDLELRAADGTPEPFGEGVLTVRQPVTRP